MFYVCFVYIEIQDLFIYLGLKFWQLFWQLYQFTSCLPFWKRGKRDSSCDSSRKLINCLLALCHVVSTAPPIHLWRNRKTPLNSVWWKESICTLFKGLTLNLGLANYFFWWILKTCFLHVLNTNTSFNFFCRVWLSGTVGRIYHSSQFPQSLRKWLYFHIRFM